MSQSGFFKKILSVVLSACILALSPGIASYRAFAGSLESGETRIAPESVVPVSLGFPSSDEGSALRLQDAGEVPGLPLIKKDLPNRIISPSVSKTAPAVSGDRVVPDAKRDSYPVLKSDQKTLSLKGRGRGEGFQAAFKNIGRKADVFSREIQSETADWNKPEENTSVRVAGLSARRSFLKPFLSSVKAKGVPQSLLKIGVLVGAAAALPHLSLAAVLMSLGAAASIVVHEAAHLTMLKKLGDDTAFRNGMARPGALSFIDPITTLALPVLSAALSSVTLGLPLAFGWGKPIPVDFNKLRNPQKDAAKVAAAGPLANIALAAGAALAAAALGGPAAAVFLALAKINLGLAAFNLLPLPQLDGGKIAVGLLSPRLYQKWIKNPALPAAYQGLYQKLYEGPSNLLTRLNLRDKKSVNIATMATTFAAFAAFSAVGWAAFGGPFAFVALVCAYDYYCVREKIQNEEAVQSVMSILQGFASDLARMAEEDEKIKSAINPEIVEHVLKQSLEDVLDRVIDSGGFAALSDDQKWERFESEYLDASVAALKAQGMSADDPETIRTVLKSDMARKKLLDSLKDWITRYEVWAKWKSPGRKAKPAETPAEKLKEKEFGKPGDSGASNMAALLPLLGIGLAAAFAPHALAAHAIFASTGFGAMIAGSLEDSPTPVSVGVSPGSEDGESHGPDGIANMDKILANDAIPHYEVYVQFKPATTMPEIRSIVGRVSSRDPSTFSYSNEGNIEKGYAIRRSFSDIAKMADWAKKMSNEQDVKVVAVNSQVRNKLASEAIAAPVVQTAAAAQPAQEPPVEADQTSVPDAQSNAGVESSRTTNDPEVKNNATTAPKAPARVDIPFSEEIQKPQYKFSQKEQLFLSSFLTDMPAEESNGQPVSGRDEEVSKIHRVVTAPRGDITSVVLYGPAGVGKTALVEKYARMWPELGKTEGKYLLHLDLGRLLTGDSPAQALQGLLGLVQRLNDSDKRRGNKVILFIDEIHRLLQSADGEKMTNMLKEPLARGNLSIIAATTEKEYKKFIEPDEALTRRLYPIFVREETPSEALRALEGARSYLEHLYGADISPEALKAAAELSEADAELRLPGRAFKYLNLALREADFNSQRDRLRLAVQSAVEEIQYVVGRLSEELSKTESATQNLNENEPTTISLYNRLAGLSARLALLSRDHALVPNSGRPKVTDKDVSREISAQTGIEEGQLAAGKGNAEKYLGMERELAKRVIGQEEAIGVISEAVRMNKAGLSSPDRPMGVFYLNGPTGTGKTHFAKELARFLFGDPNALIRLDMSEFQESHTVSRLIGSPPGYVGYGEGGQLTEQVRRKPYSVILLDEAEKAHPDVWMLLLQALGEGRLTDGQGRTVKFSHTVILMTSNLGMREIPLDGFVEKYEALRAKGLEAARRGDAEEIKKIEAEKEKLGEEISRETKARAKEVTEDYFKRVFPPEFRGRLHADPIIFNRTTQEAARKISELNLEELAKLLAKSGHELVWTPELVSFLTDQGFSIELGARPLQNALNRYVTQPVARKLLESAGTGQALKIKATAKNGEVLITTSPLEKKPETKKEPGEAAADAIFNQALAAALKMTADPAILAPTAEIIRSWADAASGVAPKDGAKIAEGVLASLEPAESFFNPDASLQMPEAEAVQAAHNDSARKDASILALKKTLEAKLTEEGYSPEVRGFYQEFLPLFAALAKDETPTEHRRGSAASKSVGKWPENSRETPLKVFYSIGENSARVLIHRGGEMSGEEKALLKTHFGGTVPENAEDSRNRAEALNVRGKDGRRLLFELHRALAKIPGAKIGYAENEKARSGLGVDYWVEIPKIVPDIPETVAPEVRTSQNAPVSAASSIETPSDAVRAGFHKYAKAILDQKEERSHSVRMAASDLFAATSTPEDLEKARDWMRFEASDMGRWYPEVAAAAQILARYGDVSDEARLFKELGYFPSAHLFKAARGRVTESLTHLLARLAAQDPEKKAKYIADVQRNEIGYFQALALIEMGAHDAALAKEAAAFPNMEFLYHHLILNNDHFAEEFYSSRDSASSEEERVLRFLAVAAKGTVDDESFFERNLSGIYSKSDEFSALLIAYGLFIQRMGYPERRAALWSGFSDNADPNLQNETLFVPLMKAITAAQYGGDEEDLPRLERIMRVTPNFVHFSHEITQQAAAEAWADIVVRTGLITRYLRPEADGQESKISRMLADTNPILNAAALKALRLYFLDKNPEQRLPALADPILNPAYASSPVAPTTADRDDVANMTKISVDGTLSSPNKVVVAFKIGGKTEEEIKSMLRRDGLENAYYLTPSSGMLVSLTFKNIAECADWAKKMSNDPGVESVHVRSEVWALLGSDVIASNPGPNS